MCMLCRHTPQRREPKHQTGETGQSILRGLLPKPDQVSREFSLQNTHLHAHVHTHPGLSQPRGSLPCSPSSQHSYSMSQASSLHISLVLTPLSCRPWGLRPDSLWRACGPHVAVVMPVSLSLPLAASPVQQLGLHLSPQHRAQCLFQLNVQ